MVVPEPILSLDEALLGALQQIHHTRLLGLTDVPRLHETCGFRGVNWRSHETWQTCPILEC